MLCGSALVASGFSGAALADGQGKGKGGDTLVVSRVQYVAPSPLPAPPNTFPQIFTNANVSGIQGNIFLDYYGTRPGAGAEAPGIDREFGGPGPADYNQLQLEVRGVAAPLARRPLPDLYGLQFLGGPRRGIEFGNDKARCANHRRDRAVIR